MDNVNYKETAEMLDVPLGATTNLVAGAREAMHRQIAMQSRTGVDRSLIMPVRTDAEREEHC